MKRLVKVKICMVICLVRNRLFLIVSIMDIMLNYGILLCVIMRMFFLIRFIWLVFMSMCGVKIFWYWWVSFIVYWLLMDDWWFIFFVCCLNVCKLMMLLCSFFFWEVVYFVLEYKWMNLNVLDFVLFVVLFMIIDWYWRFGLIILFYGRMRWYFL